MEDADNWRKCSSLVRVAKAKQFLWQKHKWHKICSAGQLKKNIVVCLLLGPVPVPRPVLVQRGRMLRVPVEVRKCSAAWVCRCRNSFLEKHCVQSRLLCWGETTTFVYQQCNIFDLVYAFTRHETDVLDAVASMIDWLFDLWTWVFVIS